MTPSQAALAGAVVAALFLSSAAVILFSVEGRNRQVRGELAALRAVQSSTRQRSRGRELYPGMSDSELIAACPVVHGPDGPIALRDWLRHFAGDGAWCLVMSLFYQRASVDPEVAAYVARVDIEQLQRHFLATLMIIGGQGVTVGVVRRLIFAHADICSHEGNPIDRSTWDRGIGVLVEVLSEIGGVPAKSLVALATIIEPIRGPRS